MTANPATIFGVCAIVAVIGFAWFLSPAPPTVVPIDGPCHDYAYLRDFGTMTCPRAEQTIEVVPRSGGAVTVCRCPRTP